MSLFLCRLFIMEYLLRKRLQDVTEKKVTKKTSAENSREYRRRRKEDSEKYSEHRQYENLRVKCYMSGLDEEKRAKYRETTRKKVWEGFQNLSNFMSVIILSLAFIKNV